MPHEEYVGGAVRLVQTMRDVRYQELDYAEAIVLPRL